MKRIITVLVLIVLISGFGYFIYNSYAYHERIFKDEIKAHVISVVKDRGRHKIYYNQASDTGFKLKLNEDIAFGDDNFFYDETFHINELLLVGDSIVKSANSLHLEVYRRDDQYMRKYKAFEGE